MGGPPYGDRFQAEMQGLRAHDYDPENAGGEEYQGHFQAGIEPEKYKISRNRKKFLLFFDSGANIYDRDILFSLLSARRRARDQKEVQRNYEQVRISLSC